MADRTAAFALVVADQTVVFALAVADQTVVFALAVADRTVVLTLPEEEGGMAVSAVVALQLVLVAVESPGSGSLSESGCEEHPD